MEYQGLKPPVDRSDEDFDPGAKYHIPSGTPYIRYFISFVIQFQFHKAMCKESGHVGQLHLCNNYGSKAAGKKLREMLSLGSSVPWWEALEKLTGSQTIDSSAIQEYFAPLIAWLKEQNGDNVGWNMDLWNKIFHSHPGKGPVQIYVYTKRTISTYFDLWHLYLCCFF